VAEAKLGRSAHVVRPLADDHRHVDRLHLIADDLADDTFEEWAEEGIRELEAYLEKHAAFLTFLDALEA
jgi:hypothetical protein